MHNKVIHLVMPNNNLNLKKNNIFRNITLVIPAKSEQQSLPIVIKQLRKFNIKKIVVTPKNENYTNLNDKKNLYFLNQKKNGYGNALIEGINKVKTKYFCIFNADGSFKPNELGPMYSKLLKENLDFVFGCRYSKNGKSEDDTFLTKIGNYFFTKIGQFLFSIKITDILYTYVLGTTKNFKKLNIKSNDFSFCVELPIKIQSKNMRYSCIASHERKRLFGIKKVNEFKDGLKILISMIKFFFKLRNKS